MNKDIRIHYLEVVTKNVEQVCESYAKSLGVTFSDSVAELGGARTASIANGGTLGVRPPMHDAEESATRPYYLVADIEASVELAKNNGAEVALPPMEILGRGRCAILMYGPIQSGLWQL